MRDKNEGKTGRRDIAWNHCVQVAGEKTLLCNYCQKSFLCTITRIKHHLACTGMDISGCERVPASVRDFFQQKLQESQKLKSVVEEGESSKKRKTGPRDISYGYSEDFADEENNNDEVQEGDGEYIRSDKDLLNQGAIDQIQPGLGVQNQKPFLQNTSQFQILPQQQQLLSQVHGAGNISSSTMYGEMDPQRLRGVPGGVANAKDGQSTANDGSIGSPMQSTSSKINMPPMQHTSSQQQQTQQDPLWSQIVQQNNQKRKRPSSSGAANSTGTGNTVGPSPNSQPSTPSTHTPGDSVAMASNLQNVSGMLEGMLTYCANGVGVLASSGNQQINMPPMQHTSSQQQQTQQDPLWSQLVQQNNQKRKGPSSSGAANSTGTGNTVGPSPNSQPSTPSTHTPGDSVAMASNLQNVSGMLEGMLTYCANGVGVLASSGNQQINMPPMQHSSSQQQQTQQNLLQSQPVQQINMPPMQHASSQQQQTPQDPLQSLPVPQINMPPMQHSSSQQQQIQQDPLQSQQVQQINMPPMQHTSSQQQQTQQDPLWSQLVQQNNQKRKGPSSSGAANSTGTGNTVGPSPNSQPSTPSTHTPGDSVAMATNLQNVSGMLEGMLTYCANGVGVLASSGNQQINMPPMQHSSSQQQQTQQNLLQSQPVQQINMPPMQHAFSQQQQTPQDPLQSLPVQQPINMPPMQHSFSQQQQTQQDPLQSQQVQQLLEDMDQFGDVASLDDHVESFLSPDAGDGRDFFGKLKQNPEHATEPSKGLSFNEVSSIRTSTNKVNCCHFSSDGKLLASSGHDKKVVLWNMETQQTASTLDYHTLIITDVRFRPNSTQLATSSFDTTIRLWDAGNPSYSIGEYRGHTSNVMSLDFHPKKTELVCSCDNNKEMRYWSITQDNSTRVSKGGSGKVRFQPRIGQFMAAVSGSTVSIYDVENDRQTRSLQGHTKDVSCLSWDTNGDLLATVCQDRIRVWSLNSEEFIHEFDSSGNSFYSCVFHPIYSNLLVIGGYQTLVLWNLHENKYFSIRAHECEITAMAMSPAIRMVASGSYDKSIKIWK